jgi:class 3 adenylate cyclase
VLNLQTRRTAISSTPSEEQLNDYNAPCLQERIEATILFADIVGSTELLVQIGDDCWADMLQQYYVEARGHVTGFDGHLLGINGDGFLASFHDPSLAARCALALRSSIQRLGLKIRIGMHFGQYLTIGDLQVGLALHIGARIAAAANPNEVLISEPLRRRLINLQMMQLIETGDYYLKGLPGEWRLFKYEAAHEDPEC